MTDANVHTTMDSHLAFKGDYLEFQTIIKKEEDIITFYFGTYKFFLIVSFKEQTF